jgi:hypothetical protein
MRNHVVSPECRLRYNAARFWRVEELTMTMAPTSKRDFFFNKGKGDDAWKLSR